MKLLITIPTKEMKISIPLAKFLTDSKVTFYIETNPFLDMARNLLLYRAMKSDADAVLMLDDDIIPKVPLEVVVNDKLIEENDVVCGIYWVRSTGSVSVAVENELFDGLVWLPQPPVKPLRVSVCGTGFMIVNTDFLRKTFPKAKEIGGWFRTQIEDWDKGKYIGEDVFFFKTFRPNTVADPKLTAWHRAYGMYYFNEHGVIEAPFIRWGEE